MCLFQLTFVKEKKKKNNERTSLQSFEFSHWVTSDADTTSTLVEEQVGKGSVRISVIHAGYTVRLYLSIQSRYLATVNNMLRKTLITKHGVVCLSHTLKSRNKDTATSSHCLVICGNTLTVVKKLCFFSPSVSAGEWAEKIKENQMLVMRMLAP